MIFELRCGNCQDVIVGQHPEGGEYQIIGNPASIPEAPPILLDMLQHWDDWKLAFDSVLNTDAELPKYKPHKPQKGENCQSALKSIHLTASNNVQQLNKVIPFSAPFYAA
jgi:hypothetical protein